MNFRRGDTVRVSSSNIAFLDGVVGKITCFYSYGDGRWDVEVTFDNSKINTSSWFSVDELEAIV